MTQQPLHERSQQPAAVNTPECKVQCSPGVHYLSKLSTTTTKCWQHAVQPCKEHNDQEEMSGANALRLQCSVAEQRLVSL